MSSRSSTTLRTRLVVAISGVVIATLAVAGVLSTIGIARAERRAATENLRSQATLLQREASRALQRASTGGPGGRLVRLRDALDSLRSAARVADARIVFVRDGTVLDPSAIASTRLGRLLLGTDDAANLFGLPTPEIATRLGIATLAPGSTATGRNGDTVELATNLGAYNGARAQAVLVATRTVDTNAARRAARALIPAAGVALALGVVVAMVIARRLTASLRVIDTTAAALAAGDHDARVELSGNPEREVAEVARSINTMADDLDAARGAQREFLQAVGHDLRTPITAIRGWADALGDGTVDDADPAARRRAAEVIGTEAGRLDRLVKDLLDLARLDAREFSLHPEPVAAGAVVANTVEGFRPSAERHGSTLVVELTGLGADDPVVLDAERLAQLVANLLDNALRHARSTVTVTATRRDSRLQVEVADDGSGIPAASVPHIFERHWTQRRSPDAERGNGLGLTIVRELARAMGGDAELSFTGPTGTTIAVWMDAPSAPS